MLNVISFELFFETFVVLFKSTALYLIGKFNRNLTDFVSIQSVRYNSTDSVGFP